MISVVIFLIVGIVSIKIFSSTTVLMDINAAKIKTTSEMALVFNLAKMEIRYAKLFNDDKTEHHDAFLISELNSDQPYSSLIKFYSTKDDKYHRLYQKDRFFISQVSDTDDFSSSYERILSDTIHTLIFSKVQYGVAADGKEDFPYIELSVSVNKKTLLRGNSETALAYVDNVKLLNP
jgi:hypothetical protein